MDRSWQWIWGSLFLVVCASVALWRDMASTPGSPTTTAAQDSLSRGDCNTNCVERPQALDLRDVSAKPLAPLTRLTVEPAAFPGWGNRRGPQEPSTGMAAELSQEPAEVPTIELPPQITDSSPSATPIQFAPTTATTTIAPTPQSFPPENLSQTQRVADASEAADTSETSEVAENPPLTVPQLTLPPENVSSLPSHSHGSSPRSAVVDAAIAQSASMCREARRLASRGALFSARAEFLSALRTLAAAHDQTDGGQSHLQAFTAALWAMEEAKDFDCEFDLMKLPDLAHLVGGHRTKLLSEQELVQLAPAQARDRYLQHAIEQLTLAVGGEPAAADPLFGLGRVSTANIKREGSRGLQSTTAALVWYHAAINVEPRHFHAAHELGTLYARRGDWTAARTVLQRAASLGSHPHTWRNLAAVHRKLGETEWAAAAQARAGDAATRPVLADNQPEIEWVDAEVFAKSNRGAATPLAATAKSPQTPAKSAPAENPADRTAKKTTSANKWFPWKR